MGVLLLGIVIALELFFLIWSFIKKDRHDQERLIARTAGIVILVLLLVVGVLQGLFRYGMLLAILIIQAGIGFLIWKKKKEKPFTAWKQVLRFLGNIMLYSFSLVLAIVLPQYKEPEVTGNYQVKTAEYTWVDDSRVETFTNTGENRAVTIKVWYPEEEGIYPLVVFSHGSFGVLDSNTSTCMNLASNGYVAVSIAHPYHAAYVMDANGKLTIGSSEFIQQVYGDNGDDSPEAEGRVFTYSRDWMEVRSGDINFVLDTMLQKAAAKEEPFSRIDSDKIGLFGHSMGGAAAVELGRERTDIDAVIDIEGTMFGEYLDFKDGAYVYNDDPYPVPLLDMNSREIYDQIMRVPEENGVDYVNVNTWKHAKDYHTVVINGVSHMNFTDLAMVSPILANVICQGTVSSGTATADAREAIETVNSIVLEYFNYYLKNSGTLDLQSEYLK